MKTLQVIFFWVLLSVVSSFAQRVSQSDLQSPGYYRATLGAFEITVPSDRTARGI
jgi:hypothetical protein